jgi:hypothetical protein
MFRPTAAATPTTEAEAEAAAQPTNDDTWEWRITMTKAEAEVIVEHSLSQVAWQTVKNTLTDRFEGWFEEHDVKAIFEGAIEDINPTDTENDITQGNSTATAAAASSGTTEPTDKKGKQDKKDDNHDADAEQEEFKKRMAAMTPEQRADHAHAILRMMRGEVKITFIYNEEGTEHQQATNFEKNRPSITLLMEAGRFTGRNVKGLKLKHEGSIIATNMKTTIEELFGDRDNIELFVE